MAVQGVLSFWRARPALRAGLLGGLMALAWAPRAQARNLEADRLFVGLDMGAGGKLPTALGASPAAGVVGLGAEYTLHKAYAVVADLTLGMAGTTTVMGALGMRGRMTDLGLALSPWAQVQWAAGGLFDLLGANVPWMGTRVGVGSDYFLTSNITVGAGLFAHLGGTLSTRGAFYGQIQGLLSVRFGLNSSRPIIPHPLPVLGA